MLPEEKQDGPVKDGGSSFFLLNYDNNVAIYAAGGIKISRIMPPKTSKWNTSFCYNHHAPGKPVHPRQRGTSVRRAEQEVISISENDKKQEIII